VNTAGSPPRAVRLTEPSRLSGKLCLVICALAVCGFADATARSDEDGVATASGRIHVSVRPNPAEANAVTRFRFVVTRHVGDSVRPVRGATVTFAGARARTDRRGRAFIVRRLRAGNYRARACKTSLACGIVRVEVLPHGAAR
jgi:hypothetical protein